MPAHKQNTEQNSSFKTPDPLEHWNRWMALCFRIQVVMREKMDDPSFKDWIKANPDPFNLTPSIQKYWESAFDNPQEFIQSNINLWDKTLNIWSETWNAFIEGKALPDLTAVAGAQDQPKDRRFKNALWQANPVFSVLRQAYLLTAEWLSEQIQSAENLDEVTRKKLQFFTRQYVDALSPTNFPFSNPDVLEEIIQTGGLSLLEGLENMLDDLEQAKGFFAPATTDKQAFEVGKNLATTQGSVVFENEMMQLIQYAPSTNEAYKTPLLIIPPWINKYYILDMKPENSLIKWCVDQGHTVFIISWVNPDETLRHKDFNSYASEGVLAALHEVEKITGEKQTNIIGYCIGGTLLSCVMSAMHKRGDADRIKSTTFLTTLVDFEDAGDLKIFIDEDQIALMEERMEALGYLDSAYLKATFSMLRANDLIWSFVINNYLLGKDPFPFDLLFWNDDSVNLPQAMQSYYLRNMYLQNNIIKPNTLEILGEKIDLRAIKTPSYFLSTREDHIAPWRATYQTTQHFSGDCTFTLAASGHIAGVVNPPSKGKYGHWTYDQTPKDPQDWIDNAVEQNGSWWLHWQKWISAYAGDKQPARKIKTAIEPAPGRYVTGQK